jgi:diguanylate cyclase (GGDEF)-like protein
LKAFMPQHAIPDSHTPASTQPQGSQVSESAIDDGEGQEPVARRGRRASRPATEGRISLNVSRLEPWVPWSMAAATAWVTLFMFPDVMVLWLYVLYAGVLGKWGQLFPARGQGRMFTHGALLICAAYLLHAHTSDRIDGPGGPFFFWIAIPAMAYALMLKPRWAMGLVLLAAAEFTLAAFVADAPLALSIALLGILVLFPLALALPFGEALRKPDELLELSRHDTATGLLNRQGLTFHGDELLRNCRREKKPVTLAIVACEDLASVRQMYGRKVGRKALGHLIDKLEAVAGSRGLVARTGPAQFSLLIPGAVRDKALQTFGRHLGSPLRLEFDAGSEEIVMLPLLVLETARVAETSIESLHAELCAELIDTMAAVRQGAIVPEPQPSVAPVVPAPTPILRDTGEPSTLLNPMPSTLPAGL